MGLVNNYLTGKNDFAYLDHSSKPYRHLKITKKLHASLTPSNSVMLIDCGMVTKRGHKPC